VQEWPVIGERVYAGWLQASTNLSGFMAEHHSQVSNIARALATRLAGAGLGALQFLVSFIIAAVFIASTETTTQAMSRLLTRIAGKDGEALRALSVATIRSIAVGVLGIAVIQAVAAGLGIALVGVPAAGLWALIVLVLAIMQLPPWLVLLPMAVYVFSIESTTVAVIFAIWSLIVSFSDAVLKPMLLGRGVDAPMIVILLGAIGGMLMSGIIGLFVGAVVLGLSYKLFRMWLASGDVSAVTGDASGDEVRSS
jgi:predicted PurR-regulated permease PerM